MPENNHEAVRPQRPVRHRDRGHQGQTTAHVRIELPGGTMVTASITNEAVNELALKVGGQASAIVKASDRRVCVPVLAPRGAGPTR